MFLSHVIDTTDPPRPSLVTHSSDVSVEAHPTPTTRTGYLTRATCRALDTRLKHAVATWY